VGTQLTTSTHPIENIVIPPFDAQNERHATLARLSREAHEATARSDEQAVAKAERAIDKTVAGLWPRVRGRA
jgi:hypothetical protein